MFVFIKYSKTHIECRKLKNEVLCLINEPILEVELILIFHNKSLIIEYDIIYEINLISFFNIGIVILIIVVLIIQILI